MSDVTECSGCGEPITAAGCERCRYDSEAGYLKAQLAAVKKERDAATGALTAAMDEVAWLTAEAEALATNSPALVEIRDHGLRFLSSPAADLAARHDTEVERRALEEVWPVIEEAIDWMGHNPPTTGYGTLDHGQDKDRADIVRRLRAFEPGPVMLRDIRPVGRRAR